MWASISARTATPMLLTSYQHTYSRDGLSKSAVTNFLLVLVLFFPSPLSARLPVSNFARDLLAKFQDEAVFSVNPEQHPVYRRVPVMGQAKVGEGVG